jgi:hypothetical protein
MQPDAVPATEIAPILCGIIIPNAIPIAGCGAADAPGVSRQHPDAILFTGQLSVQASCSAITSE